MYLCDLVFPPAPRRTCRVRAGRGVLDRLLDEVSAAPPGRPLIVVADANVAPLHAVALAQRLQERGLDVARLQFPAGEPSKIRETKAVLEDRLLDLGAGRDAALVAVGGGVTGDLVGFLAATWQRGIPVVQVPTSLLAMADAALGGKTAVDLPGGKNMVGAFHQPWGVYADVSVLSTLPDDAYADGFAEVVKSAVVADVGLFRWLEDHADELLGRDPEAQARVVSACLEIKGRVVRADERETGRRALLNFGHTVAHAIETASGYGIRHGPAVAIGMCVEADLAQEATGLSRNACLRIERLLEAFGLPVRLPRQLDLDAVVEGTRRDKKVRDGRVRYALPRALGRMLPRASITCALDAPTLRAALGRRLT